MPCQQARHMHGVDTLPRGELVDRDRGHRRIACPFALARHHDIEVEDAAFQEWKENNPKCGANCDPNGDLDGDGVSNYLEYLAGTFAGDASEKTAIVPMSARVRPNRSAT